MTTPMPADSAVQPRQSSRAKTWANLTARLMVLLGLYWSGIACLQLLIAFASAAGSTINMSLVFTALWNIVISALNLWFIRDIRGRRRSVRSGFGFLVVGGILWGSYGIATGVWVQIPAVVMYVLLGLLLVVNRNYYTETTEQMAKPGRGETLAYLTMGLIILAGLYWLELGGFQVYGELSANAGAGLQATQVCTGLFTVAILAIHLLIIRDIRARKKSVRRSLGVLVVAGTAWGVFCAAVGGYLHIPTLIIYVLLGVLLFVNRSYYTEAGKRKIGSGPATKAQPPTPSFEAAQPTLPAQAIQGPQAPQAVQPVAKQRPR